MTVRRLTLRKWKVMALVTLTGDNAGRWWCVGRRLTRDGAARAAARKAREGVSAAPAVLPIRTVGWGYCHEDDEIPQIVGLGPDFNLVSVDGEGWA